MSSPQPADSLSIAEAAAVTGLTILTLQRHARGGRIAATKVRGQWRIPAGAVEHYVRYGRWPRTPEVAKRIAARRAAGRRSAPG